MLRALGRFIMVPLGVLLGSAAAVVLLFSLGVERATQAIHSRDFDVSNWGQIFDLALGLYGLAIYNTLRRTKEIGVRKVMGGSVWSIVLLLTNDFSKLVLLSNLIAWPVAWFAMERWLSNFAYRIDISVWIFLISGALAFFIAWLTVSYQSIKAAIQNPVQSLRSE